jgi:type IV secretion system protein VirB10
MAKPITDPLRPDPDDISDVDLNDPQHDDINKGMPARNYKMWGVAIGAVAVAGMLAWPTQPLIGKAPAADAVRGPNDQQPGAAVVAALKSDADDRKSTGIARPTGGTAYDPNVGPNNGTAAGALFGNGNAGGAPQLTPEQLEQARRESIIASGTEANEVSLPAANGVPRESRADQVAREAAERSKAANDQQMKLLETIANGSFGGQRSGANGAPASASNPNEDFMARAGAKGVEPAQYMTSARAGLALYQGTIVRTVLDKAINTDLPGSIRAHVTSDVFDSIFGTRLLIPRGSVVIGEYSTGLVVGQERVLVALTRMILPNGKSVSLLGAPAEDGQGVSGLSADVDNHFLKMFGASMLIGAASLLQPKSQQNITINTNASGGTQTGGTVFSSTLQDTIKSIMQRNLNIKPTGTVDLGETFTFTLSRDIVMEEYKGPAQ